MQIFLPVRHRPRVASWHSWGRLGRVTTFLSALVARSAPGTVDALGPVVTAGSFGVGKGLAVLIALFAFLLGAMVLGGHLGAASRRRKTRRKRH
jgi:hypothetical protein